MRTQRIRFLYILIKRKKTRKDITVLANIARKVYFCNTFSKLEQFYKH